MGKNLGLMFLIYVLSLFFLFVFILKQRILGYGGASCCPDALVIYIFNVLYLEYLLLQTKQTGKMGTSGLSWPGFGWGVVVDVCAF